jgi:hypothetical protein
MKRLLLAAIFLLACLGAAPPPPAPGARPRRGAGVVERGGLENRCTFWVPWVRIPPPPPFSPCPTRQQALRAVLLVALESLVAGLRRQCALRRLGYLCADCWRPRYGLACPAGVAEFVARILPWE